MTVHLEARAHGLLQLRSIACGQKLAVFLCKATRARERWRFDVGEGLCAFFYSAASCFCLFVSNKREFSCRPSWARWVLWYDDGRSNRNVAVDYAVVLILF